MIRGLGFGSFLHHGANERQKYLLAEAPACQMITNSNRPQQNIPRLITAISTLRLYVNVRPFNVYTDHRVTYLL